MNLFIEYDAGTENTAFFDNTKVRRYSALFIQSQPRPAEFKVLTFAPGVRRIVSLMKQTVRPHP